MKDQKYFEEALKNSANENVPDDPLILLNNPPVRNELSRNPTRSSMIKPLEKEEIRFLNDVPRSANTSTFIPARSFSVIILFPNPVIIILFNGIATRHIRRRNKTMTKMLPFHDFTEPDIPDLIQLNIFINDYSTMK